MVTPEEIRQYCIYLKTEKKLARQTSTQAICAIKIFWEKTLKRVWPLLFISKRAGGLKVRHLIAWAAASPTSKAQVKASVESRAL